MQGLEELEGLEKLSLFKTLFHTLLLDAWSNTVYAQSRVSQSLMEAATSATACLQAAFIICACPPLPLRNKQQFMHSA